MSDMALLWHYIQERIFRPFRHGNEKISFPSNTTSTKDDVAIMMKNARTSPLLSTQNSTLTGCGIVFSCTNE
jgi:hypothetical protein